MDSIKDGLMDLDLTGIVPKLSSFLGFTKFLLAAAMLIAPVLLLVSGLRYFNHPEKEANHKKGYRTYYGMGSPAAWHFTQRYAGRMWVLTGAALTVAAGITTGITVFTSGLTMATAAVICLAVEAVAIVAVNLHINRTVQRRFDKDGNKK